MKFSKAKQFWTWFQKNRDTYLKLHQGTKDELVYYMRELFTHLLVYGKGIGAEIGWGAPEKGESCKLIITAYGQRKHFRKVEMLVAKAPIIPGWEVVTLQPPRPVDFFIKVDFPQINIDPFDLWFVPPKVPLPAEKVRLSVYVETYSEITGRFTQAVLAVIFNVLGERVYAQEVGDVYVDNLLELAKDERASLVNLQHLQEYIKPRGLSTIVINGNGFLEERDH